jgi:hypothetical protein
MVLTIKKEQPLVVIGTSHRQSAAFQFFHLLEILMQAQYLFTRAHKEQL